MTDMTGAAPSQTVGLQADLLIAEFVGIASFLIVVGPNVLNVGNMLWLTQGSDPFQHYIGWEFFRRSAWTWPLGLNPQFGMQFSSSIIFSDSVPLLAIPLKLLSPLLPTVFQYTGWWVLGCFLLQAYFAARIAGLFARSVLIKAAVAVLLTFAPPMLWRLSIHYSLVAHWTILAGVYLYWKPTSPRRSLAWAGLLAACALIHTYLFAMLLPIWLASLVRRHGQGERPRWVLESGAVLMSAVLLLWVGGFFPLRSSMLTFGYGFFRLNLLALFNPDGSMQNSPSWSVLLPRLPHGNGDYEGFAYAGLGGLAAVMLAAPAVVTERHAYRGKGLWPIASVAVLLTLFALSPHLTIGDRLITIPAPQIIYELAGSLRSSGRFFWPVYYLIFIGAIWLLCRALGERVAGPVLLLLAALQVYDTSPGWLATREHFAPIGSTYSTSLDDPRLDEIATHYRAIRALPAGNGLKGWRQVAYFAWRSHLPTDGVYLARPDDAGYEAYMADIDSVIAAHGLATDSLYFVNVEFARKIAVAMRPDDAMFEAGDFYAYAPGWRTMQASTTLPEAPAP